MSFLNLLYFGQAIMVAGAVNSKGSEATIHNPDPTFLMTELGFRHTPRKHRCQITTFIMTIMTNLNSYIFLKVYFPTYPSSTTNDILNRSSLMNPNNSILPRSQTSHGFAIVRVSLLIFKRCLISLTHLLKL